jgi:hypothetical protein
MAADETIRGMFFLPQSTDLNLHSHVVLTSRGTVAADREGSGTRPPPEPRRSGHGKGAPRLVVLRRAAVSTGEKAR